MNEKDFSLLKEQTAKIEDGIGRLIVLWIITYFVSVLLVVQNDFQVSFFYLIFAFFLIPALWVSFDLLNSCVRIILIRRRRETKSDTEPETKPKIKPDTKEKTKSGTGRRKVMKWTPGNIYQKCLIFLRNDDIIFL